VRDPDGATHLDTAARRMLRLGDAQRIAGIDRDLWIGYGRAHDAHERLERILRSERRMRPDNLLIVGASDRATWCLPLYVIAKSELPDEGHLGSGAARHARPRAPPADQCQRVQ
jgi:Bacterial TniB protein